MTSATTAATSLTFTGERFVPEVRGAIWYEHWHRYVVAAPFAAGKRVLDAACGEGYGSFLLARTATRVTGVDISPDAVAHARERYALSNLQFVQSSVAQLPLPSASVDLVVSFETIEHLAEQREMLAEFRRVLAVDGVLVISSPNRPVYNEGGGIDNHYHVRELDRAELAALLTPLFPQQAWHAQRVLAQSVLWAEHASAGAPQFVTLADDRAASASAPAPPMYFLVVCAANGVPLPALPPVSLFDDGSLALWRDYDRARLREHTLAWDELNARKVAEDRLAELVPVINALASERDAGRAQTARIAALEAELAATQAKARDALARLELALVETQGAFRREADAHAQTAGALAHATETLAQANDSLAQERQAHDDTRARLAFRESARGWLRYPLAAARQRLAGRD